MKHLFKATCILLLFATANLEAQIITEKPKMVIGIVVDQMKQEYLTRFYHKFGENGFKRLVEQGFLARNGHYNYAPTVTGPGHASIYTGTTPANHGIAGNSWYCRVLQRGIYCAEDSTVTNVGGSPSAGKISPKNLYTSTITDALKISTQNRAKVIAMSIKDRGSALPGGHFSDGSYWYDGATGEFMTSTYYTDELPKWVSNFNEKKSGLKYLESPWTTLYPIEEYVESGIDNSPYENAIAGKSTPTFPYEFDHLDEKQKNGFIRSTPFGNTILADLALHAIKEEKLGEDDITDFLAISFSSTDYIGHSYGPRSIEVQDTYLRLDLEIARILNALDKKLGKGNYTVFLTADHGVAENSQRMEDDKFRIANFKYRDLRMAIDEALNQQFGTAKWIESGTGAIYLDRQLITEQKADLIAIQRAIAQKAETFPGVYKAYTAHDLSTKEYTEGLAHLMQNGYHNKESADVIIALDPGWQGGGKRGTTHGSGWTYDTHVPIIMYGWGIEQGSSIRYTSITDIAPTISMLLNIRLPNGATGQPIKEVFK